MKNKIVKYAGNDYTIIYDYNNGLYEIKSLNNPLKILLVSGKDISII